MFYQKTQPASTCNNQFKSPPTQRDKNEVAVYGVGVVVGVGVHVDDDVGVFTKNSSGLGQSP